MYLGSQWIHKDAYGRISTEISPGPYRRTRWQFTAPLQFGTHIFFCCKQWRYTQQKQQWIQNGRDLKRFWRGTSQKQIRGDRWSKDEGHKISCSLTCGHLSVEDCRIGDKAPQIQRSSCTPRWHCERWFGVLCSIHWTRIISITNKGGKSHGNHIHIARVPGQAADAVSAYIQVKMEDAPKLLKIPKSEMEDPVVSLERNFYGHPLEGLSMWKATWENPFEIRLGENSKLGMSLFVHREKGLFLSVYVDDI